MKHFKFFGFALIIAVFLALLEVQIEGATGWAGNLPTWRKEVFLPILGMWGKHAKPLTGYHLYLWLFSFSLPHIAFLFSKWSVKKELYLISFYIFFSTFEGILWFIFNPAYGLAGFRPGVIHWYKEMWILGLPGEYWIRFTFAALLYNSVQENPTINCGDELNSVATSSLGKPRFSKRGGCHIISQKGKEIASDVNK